MDACVTSLDVSLVLDVSVVAGALVDAGVSALWAALESNAGLSAGGGVGDCCAGSAEPVSAEPAVP